ncbi:MAG: hypothetical protein E3J64_06995 [Anaerolineales bacterium]|nr:MAG: hypothetical protein E3J64_06995 [Anaerolineales bacterium]
MNDQRRQLARLALILLALSAACSLIPSEPDDTPLPLTSPGGTLITYVHSQNIGLIVVRVRLPEQARYPEGAPVIVDVAGWFTGAVGFHESADTTEIGAIHLDYLWPGKEDPAFGLASEGKFDYGGPTCLAALRDVIRFAAGLEEDVDGHTLAELVQITPLADNVGIYTFSHSGVMATNVLAHHGQELPSVAFLVGRENPTTDPMYPLELGYYDDDRNPVFNPFYIAQDYTPTSIHIDYSTVGWLVNDDYPAGRPYFAVPNGSDHVLGDKGPRMWGKRYFSRGLTQALLDNAALALDNWPDDLATPQETQEHWPYRTTVDNYGLLVTSAPQLKVMLVFAADDHVQAASDKPHIHQAYDGFHETAGLWVRLNPDLAYVEAVAGQGGGSGYPDNSANTEPGNWANARLWGYRGEYGSPFVTKTVPLAAAAEMADRVRSGDWSPDLDEVLFQHN